MRSAFSTFCLFDSDHLHSISSVRRIVVKAKIIYLAKITCMRAGSLYKAIKYSKT